MGVSGKWFKALVGLKKSEKPQSLDKEENGATASKSRHRRKHSVEFDADKIQEEFHNHNHNHNHNDGDANIRSIPDTSESPFDSLQVQDIAHNQQVMKEELAATRIQTAFRGFLEGWCDSVGSVEQIQAKLLKRQEAAAKRERAIAYALAHQWQAGSRQQAVPSGFEPDKSSWGWNWLERWMAVRPWENRFLDINLRDGVMIREDETAAEVKNGSKSQLKTTAKKAIASDLQSTISSQKKGPSHSDGGSSSPSKSAGMLEAPNTLFSKPKPKPVLEDLVEEANSKPAMATRSHSNPKERTAQLDKQAKKRLSLPNSGGGAGTQAARNSRNAARGTPSSQKPIRDRSKLNGKGDSNTTKSVAQAV
ncbi:protein IQ-DOMAIN 1-like isoform X4 [Populus alba x Populus x berolinensis]|nr:protein IQ-DOMAIN 1-like isoform X4 [Populus alba x Populus x berolinensis]